MSASARSLAPRRSTSLRRASPYPWSQALAHAFFTVGRERIDRRSLQEHPFRPARGRRFYLASPFAKTSVPRARDLEAIERSVWTLVTMPAPRDYAWSGAFKFSDEMKTGRGIVLNDVYTLRQPTLFGAALKPVTVCTARLGSSWTCARPARRAVSIVSRV